MVVSTFIRWSGLATVLAGVLFLIVEFLELFALDLENLGAQAATGTFAFWAGLFLLTTVLLLLGLVGLYFYQSEAAGVLGLAGFLVAFLGTVLAAGASWALLFAVPLAPEVLGTPWLFLSFLIFTVGWLLFGVATLRARVFPRATAVLLMVGAVLLLIPLMGWANPYIMRHLVLSVAVAWLGFDLFTGRVAQPERPEHVR